MKIWTKLKAWGFVALLLVGMSSCLKKNDSLNIYVQYPYILQNSNGTFTPQMRLLGSELQSASISVAGRNFAFTSINEVAWELTGGIYAPLDQLDSIPTGYYLLTATGLNGKTGNLTIAFPEAKKRIGDVRLTDLNYLKSEKKVEVTLADSVENAKDYYLMIRVPSGSSASSKLAMWTPYEKLTLEGDAKLSATVSGIELGKGMYRFSVGAGYSSTFRISDHYITVDNTDASE